jgi:ATP-dependent Clp protease ATP-binding subunit ClpA
MFERFTTKARDTVIGAQDVARRMAAEQIGSEHLLGALYDQPGNLALTVLEAFSVRREEVDAELERIRNGGFSTPDAAEALATLGIDLDEVRRQVEEAFGPGALDRTRSGLGRRWGRRGHIPFSRDAKRVMNLSLREAVLLGHNYIGCEHILLGMLHNSAGAAGAYLRSRGVRQDASRIMVEELLKRRRAG